MMPGVVLLARLQETLVQRQPERNQNGLLFINSGREGRIADFPAGSTIPLAFLELKVCGYFQQLAEPDPLPTSYPQLPLYHIAKCYFRDQHLLGKNIEGQPQVPNRFLDESTHVLACKSLAQW